MRNIKVTQMILASGTTVSLARDTLDRSKVSDGGTTHLRLMDRAVAVFDDRNGETATIVPYEQIRSLVVGKADLLAMLDETAETTATDGERKRPATPSK